MVKAVIFDLDNTLYDYEKTNDLAMKELAKIGASLFDVSEEKFLQVYDEAKSFVKQHICVGQASQHNRIFYAQRTAEIFGKGQAHLPLKLYNAYWDNFIEHIELYDGALDFLRELKSHEIRLAVCTDMTAHIQYRKLERLGIADIIDCMVTSEEAGVEKPSPIMFHLTLDKTGTHSSDTIYIGDSFERDIIGAQNVAMQAVWFTAGRTEKSPEDVLNVSDYRDARLRELCGL